MKKKRKKKTPTRVASARCDSSRLRHWLHFLMFHHFCWFFYWNEDFFLSLQSENKVTMWKHLVLRFSAIDKREKAARHYCWMSGVNGATPETFGGRGSFWGISRGLQDELLVLLLRLRCCADKQRCGERTVIIGSCHAKDNLHPLWLKRKLSSALWIIKSTTTFCCFERLKKKSFNSSHLNV